MEIRMRSAVSRTARGYSIEATLDISQADTRSETILSTAGEFLFGRSGTPEDVAESMSAFQIAELQKHMKALGAAFPREE